MSRCYICHEGDPILEAERARWNIRRPTRALKLTRGQVPLCVGAYGEGCFEKLERGTFS